MDNYKIDSHKLYYHPERVAQWLNGGDDWEKLKSVYPIYVEISPTGMCNHRCRFCAMDYIGYKPRNLDIGIMKNVLSDMGKNGVKSIMLAGEGEPLLYKHITELSEMVVSSGIDLAFTTNGVLLDEKRAESLISKSKWIKISIAAGTPETYGYIHGTEPADFQKVIKNTKNSIQLRDKEHYSCTLGAQFLLLPENYKELETIARICRDDIGLDYLVVKPYSQHLFSHTREYKSIDYSEMMDNIAAAEALENESFKVIIRKNALKNALDNSHVTEKCFATPFLWVYLMSNFDLYACSAFLKDDRFLIGNLKEKSFPEVWEGDGRHRIFKMMSNGFNTSACRLNCRMNTVNRYLWELKNPGEHDNFI